MNALAQRVAPLALPAGTLQPLLGLAGRDAARLERRPEIAQIIPSVGKLLDVDTVACQAFAQAWLLMYAAIQHLDHLQDGDEITDALLQDGTVAVQYNRVFSYYVLATSLLDAVSGQAEYMRHLRQFWTDCMLHMAFGQQLDLVAALPDTGVPEFEAYQHVIQAKTGATFALAFGGPALMAGAKSSVFDALTAVGCIYGMLLQLRDDIYDRNHTGQPKLSLPHLVSALPIKDAKDSDIAEAFWSFIYPHYYVAVVDQMATCTSRLRDGVLHLFTSVFGGT